MTVNHRPCWSQFSAGETFGGAATEHGDTLRRVRSARSQAERAGRMLSNAVGFSVEVTGIVAIVGAPRRRSEGGRP